MSYSSDDDTPSMAPNAVYTGNPHSIEVKKKSPFEPEDAIDCLVKQVKCRGFLNSNDKHIVNSWKAYEILINDGRISDAENFLVSVFRCLVTSGRTRATKEESLVKNYYDLFMRVEKN